MYDEEEDGKKEFYAPALGYFDNMDNHVEYYLFFSAFSFSSLPHHTDIMQSEKKFSGSEAKRRARALFPFFRLLLLLCSSDIISF